MAGLSLGTRIYAETGAYVTRHLILRRAVAGKEHPRITQLPFYVAETSADDLEGLVTFKGKREAGRQRAKWQIGAIAVHGEVYERALEEEENRGAWLAAAWVAGRNALLVAAIDLNGHTKVGMGVGRDDLIAGVVLWRPDNSLVIPEGGLTAVGDKDAQGRVLPQYTSADVVPQGVLMV